MPAEKQAESTVGVSEQHESDVVFSHPSSRSPNPICCLQDATAAAVVASCTQHSIDTWLVEGAVAVLCMVFHCFHTNTPIVTDRFRFQIRVWRSILILRRSHSSSVQSQSEARPSHETDRMYISGDIISLQSERWDQEICSSSHSSFLSLRTSNFQSTDRFRVESSAGRRTPKPTRPMCLSSRVCSLGKFPKP